MSGRGSGARRQGFASAESVEAGNARFESRGGGTFKVPDQGSDLCQDFGHGSSRNHAAMGSLPSAGLVRSKNNSMARAGIW